MIEIREQNSRKFITRTNTMKVKKMSKLSMTLMKSTKNCLLFYKLVKKLVIKLLKGIKNCSSKRKRRANQRKSYLISNKTTQEIKKDPTSQNNVSSTFKCRIKKRLSSSKMEAVLMIGQIQFYLRKEHKLKQMVKIRLIRANHGKKMFKKWTDLIR